MEATEEAGKDDEHFSPEWWLLNRGEAVNALKRAIYTGSVAQARARRPDEMQADPLNAGGDVSQGAESKHLSATGRTNDAGHGTAA